MKHNIKHLYNSLVPSNLSWSTSVKSRVKLASLLLRVVPLVYGSLSGSTVKITWGFATNVVKMYRTQGSKGLAKYLKASYVLLQQSAGGYIIPAPWDLGCNVARTRKGVPRLVNRAQRALILQGHVPTIRFWLSLFGLYRVIEFKGALKLSTITNPGTMSPGFVKEWKEWVPIFLQKASVVTRLSWKIDPERDLTPYSIPVIRKSSPNSGGLASVAAIPLDIIRWALEPRFLNLFREWVTLVDGVELLWGLNPIIKRIQAHDDFRDVKLDPKADLGSILNQMRLWAQGIPAGSKLWESWWPVASLGKLGFKEEPGKIRVFAMVDILTQTILYPLHKWIFGRLRPLDTDGTFDQIAPIERLIKRMNEVKRTWIASYDLSAATDRLPLVLQQELLSQVMGERLSFLWGVLLVGRAYRLPRIAKSYNLGYTSVRYAVGQPMGAYSSWAMLAMTHHAIVQLAAHRAYPREKGWFIWYLVLGDDVVIADRAVAREYLRIMKEIGVEIGLAKCLISNTTSLEFAKRTYVRGMDCSPISLDEALVALVHLGSLEELVRKQLKYGVLRLASIGRFAGFGYKTLGRLPVSFALNNRFGRLLAYLHRPGGVYPMPLWQWITAIGPDGRGDEKGNVWRIAVDLWSKIIGAAIRAATKMEAQLPYMSLYSYSTGEHGRKTKDMRGGSRGKVEFIPSYLSDGKPLVDYISQGGFNGFFTDWVTYPYTEKMRKVWQDINDILRVHSPNVLPPWEDVSEIWTKVMEADEGASLLPKQPSFIRRESDEGISRIRLMELWLRLRRLVKKAQLSGSDMSTQTVDPPKAERRWTRGLGQDRLYMDPNVVGASHSKADPRFKWMPELPPLPVGEEAQLKWIRARIGDPFKK